MGGLSVRVDMERAVREAADAFREFGTELLPRDVQFALTGTVIEGVNRWRREIDAGSVFRRQNRLTRDAVRYEVDRDALNRIRDIGEAKASVLVLPLQSVWLKYAFGDAAQVRMPGDVGIEAWFGDQTMLRIPDAASIRYTGLGSPSANGNVPGANVRRIARLAAAAGYKRNTAGSTRGSGTWGAFEVKPGDTRALNGYCHRPGIWARPPHIVAAEGRKRLKRAITAGKATAPTTSFKRGNGVEVTVPKVVNADVPRQLFFSTPQGAYKPVATPSWRRAMEGAAATMPDRLAARLADRLEHLASKRRR